MIGGRFAVRSVVASFRSERRYRRFEDARARADETDGYVVDLTAAERTVYSSPGAQEAFETGRARSW